MADLNIDLNSMTFSEMEFIEDKCGAPLSQVVSGNLTATAMRSLAYVALRRTDPEASWEDTADMKMSDIKFGDDEVPPTDANGSSS